MAFTLRKVQNAPSKKENLDNQENIHCIVKRFIYKDEESGFFVFSAFIPDTQPKVSAKVNGVNFSGRQFAIVGTSLIMTQSVVEGQEVEVWGNFEPGKQPNTIQFTAKAIQEKIPTKPKAIELFLSSGKIYGVGPKIASKIVSQHGPGTIEILDKNPELLLNIEGINLKKLEMIKKSWAEWRSIYEIIATMRIYGIGDAAGIKIFNHFKDESLKKIKEEPYDLTEVGAIGFRTADKIAQQIGKSKDDPKRIQKCLLYTLEEIAENGNTAYPKNDFLNKANELLDLDISLLRETMNKMVDRGELIEKTIKVKHFTDKARTKFDIIEKEGIAHGKIHYTESRIAKELKRILVFPSVLEAEQEKDNIQNFINQNPFDLDDSQLNAAKVILSNKVSILTGGPGTGKTHTIKSLLNYFDSIDQNAVYYSGQNDDFSEFEKLDLKSVLAAPTGRAAKRMQESTGKPSSTMHRTLGFKEGDFVHNESNQLKGDIFIIDESSMIDIWLMCSFLKAIPSNARLIFVGDVDQLPSVGAGNTLRDMIESNIIPVARLKNIHRQAKNSNIILASHDIINHKMPKLYDIDSNSDFVFVEKEGAEEVHDSILDIVNKIKKQGINSDNIQILSPKKDGEIGIKNLNETLRPLLNDFFSQYEEMESHYITGDRVMQFKNNKDLDIFNGDVGKVIYADEESASIYVDFDGRKIEIMSSDIKQLNFAYATTIHKSQGSDYPYVIIPISKSHSFMWDANLLYTAVTRGKAKVILVGDKKTLFHSIASFKQKDRITGLKEEIRNTFSTVDLSFLTYDNSGNNSNSVNVDNYDNDYDNNAVVDTNHEYDSGGFLDSAESSISVPTKKKTRAFKLPNY